MAAAQYFDQVQKIFIAFYQRPADPAGLKYWASRVDAAGGDASQVINEFATSAEATALYGTIDASSIGDVVDDIYMALFNVMPDAAGKAFYVDGFNAGTFTAGTIALAVLDGAQNDDLIALNNKVEVANEFTQQVDGRDFTDPAFGSGTAFNATYAGNADADAAREFLATVGSNPATIPSDSAVTDVIKSDIANTGDPILEVDTSGNMLTVGQDTILGTAEGQTFTAPVVQNGMGAQTNTLGSGDVIAGIGDGNKLVVDLTLTTAGALPLGDAISAATNNIQIVELRAQTPIIDIGGIYPNFSHIDAENFNGVEQWWSVNSRSAMQVEDVRTRPEDTTIGMRDTDPFVSFRVYFDPDQLDENIRTEDSALTLNIADVANPGDLSGVPIDGLSFKLDGVSYTLRSDDIGAATTYAELLAGLQAELALQPALATVSASLNPDNTITLLDSAGKPFTLGSWFFVNDSVPANGNIVFQQTVGDPSLVDVPISTNVLLDNVGRNSPGGDLDIGSLGAGGIAQFDVTVDRDSWVASMESNSYLDNGGIGLQTEHLETVNFTSIGAKGDIAVGELDANSLDGRIVDGLHDVRVVDGSAFMGQMKIGVHLTDGGGPDDTIARYLDGATGPVQFSYTGSAQADIFNINVDSGVSNDPDFRMEVNLGASDDRLILEGADNLNNISVDGGTGNNTFVTSTSVGTGINPADIADHEFASFKNFQNYEIEGSNNTSHDFTNLVGVTSVIVATQNVDTTLIDLPVANVIISGKNQTIGSNSNADQDFDDIRIQGSDGASLTVTLDNTARVDGELNVEDLYIENQNAGNVSAVRTLNIVSNGARQTSNVVEELHGNLVNTFNITGTQDFTTNIVSAANSTGAAAARTSLVVDGSALTGDFDLTLDGVVLSAVDAGTTSTVKLTGTAGLADDLRLSNVINTTTDTTISGFETIHFGDVSNGLESSGVFNATNVSGVTLYEVNNIDAALTLNNMGNVETVQINTDLNAVAGDGNLSFFAKNASATSELTLNFRDFDAATNTDFDGDFTAGGQQIAVQNFRTINVDLGSEATLNEGYLFTANVLDADGTDILTGPFIDFNWGTVNTRVLNVTGGGDQGAAGSAGGVDSVNMGQLANHLDTIDFSGYVGQTTFSLYVVDSTIDVDNVAGGVQTFDRNTTIDVNGYNMTYAELNGGVDSHITTFHFTADAVSATEDWDITGFDAFLTAGNDVSNISIMDMRDLGVTGLVDLNVVQSGVDTIITSNAGLNFEILLVGVTATDLTGDNFQFSA